MSRIAFLLVRKLRLGGDQMVVWDECGLDMPATCTFGKWRWGFRHRTELGASVVCRTVEVFEGPS